MPWPVRLPFLSAAAALVALGGCAAHKDYPSLTPRAVEHAADADATPPALPGAVADTARDTRAAALSADAVKADAAFAKEVAGSCSALTAGVHAAEGSEPWIAREQALSALDAARGPVRAAAAELDQLLIDAGGDAGTAIDTTRLAAATAQVDALEAAEQARLDSISAGGSCTG